MKKKTTKRKALLLRRCRRDLVNATKEKRLRFQWTMK